MNFLRRIPFLPTLLTVLVVVSSATPATPIFDAATRGEVIDAFLQRPLAYVALAPFSDVLDTLTLLSSNQHIAILVGALVLFGVARAFRRDASVKAHAVATLIFIASIVVLYAAAMLLPRPMASLATNNDNVLRVDFHSHTDASHDGHQSVEQLREWHRAAGYDVAYVTDHASVAGAERGLAANPNPAGEGVTLLQGIESTWNGEHVSIPNAQRVYRGILTANLGDVDTAGMRLAAFIGGREPVVIWNHPHRLDGLPPVTGPGSIGIRAIEIVNGAPKDAKNLRANRDRIAAMAQAAGVALTAGSDNHGYGRAAPGWTLMMIVGWRGATADALALKIEQVIREGGFRATRVVERRVADSGAGTKWVAASVAVVPWVMFTTLSNDERLWWLIWTWVIWGGVWYVRRRREQTA